MGSPPGCFSQRLGACVAGDADCGSLAECAADRAARLSLACLCSPLVATPFFQHVARFCGTWPRTVSHDQVTIPLPPPLPPLLPYHAVPESCRVVRLDWHADCCACCRLPRRRRWSCAVPGATCWCGSPPTGTSSGPAERRLSTASCPPSTSHGPRVRATSHATR